MWLVLSLLSFVAGAFVVLGAGLLLGWRFARARTLPTQGYWPPVGDGERVVRLTTDPGAWPWSDGSTVLLNPSTPGLDPATGD